MIAERIAECLRKVKRLGDELPAPQLLPVLQDVRGIDPWDAMKPLVLEWMKAELNAMDVAMIVMKDMNEAGHFSLKHIESILAAGGAE